MARIGINSVEDPWLLFKAAFLVWKLQNNFKLKTFYFKIFLRSKWKIWQSGESSDEWPNVCPEWSHFHLNSDQVSRRRFVYLMKIIVEHSAPVSLFATISAIPLPANSSGILYLNILSISCPSVIWTSLPPIVWSV